MERKKKKKGFSLLKILINIIFSPILIFIVSFAYYGDYQSAILVTLYAITFFNAIGLFFKLIGLLISSVTFSPFGVIKKSIDIVVSIIITGVYWLIYIIVYGSDYSL